MSQYVHDVYNTLFSNLVSFERLFQMCYAIFYKERADVKHITLFVDLNSFFSRIWDPRGIAYKADNVLAASAINACAHYRQFFKTRPRVHTRIYLVWGYNTPSCLPVEYNAHVRERIATMPGSVKLLENNLKSIQFLTKYLEDIYFVNVGDYETAAGIMAVIQEQCTPDETKIVLTKDAYAHQLVAYNPNTFLIRPKKRTEYNAPTADVSWFASKKSMYTSMRLCQNYTLRKETPNYELVNCVMALSGLKARHVRGIVTFNKACSIISNLESENPEALQSVAHLEYTIASGTTKACKGLEAEEGSIIQRGNMLDLRVMHERFIHSPEYVEAMKDISVNLYDPAGLNEISSKEFVEYPLELLDL